eukprot:jgi/Psemu1/282880/fgenesh1_pg.15_\
MAQGPASSNSPVAPLYGNGQNGFYYSYDVNSPSNSDGNNYQSPSISPGHWDDTPTSYNCTVVSPQSNGSFQGSPTGMMSPESRSPPPTTPPSTTTPSFQPPALPSELGNHDQERKAAQASKRAQGSIMRGFMEKSAMDHEREKMASRRLQSMMVDVSRNITNSDRFGKKEARAFLASTGTEGFATSSRRSKTAMVMEDLKGSVDDFKCGQARGRERAAKFHAMRMITKLDNAA